MSDSKPGPDYDATVAAQSPSLPPVTRTGAETLGGVPAQSPTTPPRFGDFVLLGELGHGGMGVVYRAEDPRLKREVAIKVMLPQFAVNPQAKARFVREARAQAKVEHDHVVAILHIADHDGLPYIVMPLLKGMTLQAALKANPRPPLPEVIRIGRETAEGLAAAHEKGLVHRDIKPANVWLEGKKLRVKVLDFGLARIATDADAEGTEGPVTREGAVIGTPAYMSPEQGRGLPVDGRTDLFSLGVMLYQMTTGELPFRGSTTLAILTALAIDNPPPPISVNPAVPQSLSDFVMRLLAKDPAYRPPTAEIAADELRAIEAGLANAVRVIALDAPPPIILSQVGPDPFAELDATEANTATEAEPIPDDDEPVAARVQPKSRGGIPMWALVGGVLLAVAGVVGFVVFQMGKKPEEVVKVEPSPAPPSKDVTKPKDRGPSDAEVRKAIETLHPHAHLGIRLKSGQTLTIEATTLLPAEPFDLISINVAPKMPIDLVPAACVAIAGQQSFESFEDYSRACIWTEADFVKLAATPAKKTLATFYTPLTLTPKTVELLREFTALKQLSIIASDADDDLLEAFAKTGKASGTFSISDLGKSRKVSEKGWAAITRLPLTSLALLSPGPLNRAACESIAKMPELSVLNIGGTEFDAAGMKALTQCPKLTYLVIAHTRFAPGTAKEIAGFKNLTNLAMTHGSELTDDDVPHLARLKTLLSLNVGTNQITEAGGKALNAALPRCFIVTSEKTFEPSDVHYREASRLLGRGCHVDVRPEGGTVTRVKSAADLPDGPFVLTGVARASNDFPFTDEDLKRLEATPTLVSLELSSASITDAGVRSALASKRTLILLYLGGCASLTDESLRALGECPNLESFHFGGSKVTDAGLKHVAGLTRLYAVGVSGTAVTDAGLKHLAGLPALRALYLDDTAVSDAGVETLAGMKGLVELTLPGTRVTEAGYKKFQAALPKCKVAWEDPNRYVARLFLERAPFVNGTGGFQFEIKLPDGKSVAADKAADLPPGPFTVVGLLRAGPQPPALTDADMKRLEALPALTNFMAHGLAISVDGLRSLLALKASLKGITIGDISDEHLKIIREFPELTGLQFGGPGTTVTDTGIAHLAGLTKLQYLSIVDTRITDAGLKHLVGLTMLSNLEIRNSAVSNDGVETLIKMKSLGTLYVTGTRISTAGYERLSKGLPNCTIIWEEPNRSVAKSLLDAGVLVGVKLANGTVIALKKGQELPTEPFTIDGVGGYGTQPITDDILKRLEATPTLTGIVGNGSPITGVGLRSLVASKATLWHVHLGGQPFTDDDMKTLAELTATVGLNIGFAKITDDGLKPLATLPVLDNLHLCGTGITDAGVVHLKNCKKLTKLFLSKTKVTEAGIEELKKALPQCWIEWDGGVIDPTKKP